VPTSGVNVPEIVPTALMTPFTNEKLVVVSVPANVPTPGIAWTILVTNPVPAGGAAAAGAGTISIDAVTIPTAISGARKLLRFMF